MAFWDGNEYIVMGVTILAIVLGSVAVWWFMSPKEAQTYVDAPRSEEPPTYDYHDPKCVPKETPCQSSSNLCSITDPTRCKM